MLKLNFWPPKRYTFKALLCYDCVVLSIALIEVIKFSLINGTVDMIMKQEMLEDD